MPYRHACFSILNVYNNEASGHPNSNHYIIGCVAIGEFNGNSDKAFKHPEWELKLIM